MLNFVRSVSLKLLSSTGTISNDLLIQKADKIELPEAAGATWGMGGRGLGVGSFLFKHDAINIGKQKQCILQDIQKLKAKLTTPEVSPGLHPTLQRAALGRMYCSMSSTTPGSLHFSSGQGSQLPLIACLGQQEPAPSSGTLSPAPSIDKIK